MIRQRVHLFSIELLGFLRHGFGLLPVNHLQHKMKFQKLLVFQRPRGLVDLIHGAWEMQAAQRRLFRQQAVLCLKRRRYELFNM